MKKSTLFVLAACSFIFFTGSGLLRAASIWDGDTDANWTNAGNWDVLPVPSATETLTFAGALGLTNNNDFAANSQFNTLTFAAAAGSFTLGGNAINLGDGTGTAGTKITNSSSSLQTINTSLELLQTTTLATGTTPGSGITLGGNISGTGFGLNSTQAGGLTLSGSNSYSGPTSVTGAAGVTASLTLVANAGNTSSGISSALSPNSALTLAPTSTTGLSLLQLRADDSTAFNTSTGGVTFTASSTARQMTIDVNQNNAGNTDKTLTLGGTFTINLYTVTTTIVNVTGGNGYGLALGNVDLRPNSTGNTHPDFNVSAPGGLSIASVQVGNVISGGNAPASTGLSFTGSGHTIITGDLVRSTNSRAMTLTQNGSGSLTLTGSATNASATNLSGYTFNLSAGTLNVNNPLAMGATASVGAMRTVNITGGTLDNTSAGDITLTGNPVLFLNGNFTFGATRALNMGTGIASLGNVAGARTITTNGTSNALTLGNATEAGASMNLTKEGTGRLVLTGPAFHTGGTTINAGTLEVNGASVAALSGQSGTFVPVATNGTHFDITVPSTANIKAGQAISGTNIPAGTLVREVRSGTGLRLTQGTLAAGTFTDLAYSAGSGAGTGPVTVNGTNTTLSGNGTLAGAATVNTGAILAPGSNTTGALSNYGGISTTQTFSGGLTLAAGSKLNFDTGDRANVTGGIFTISGGAVTIDNGATLNSPGAVYTLFNYSGATLAGSVTNLTLTNPLSGVTAAFSTDGSNNVLLTLTAGGSLSSNADLSSLVVTTATLSPVFDANTLTYTATVPYLTSSVTVTPTKAQAGASITVNTNPVTSGSPSSAITLNEGANGIAVVVTAEDSSTKTYTLTVTRQAPATLNEWRLRWYNTPSNTGNAADTASPFGTGLSNLQVYAFMGPGQNPATASASQLPQFVLSPTTLSFTFTEPAGVTGIVYGARFKTDLLLPSWTNVPDTGTGTQHIFSVPRGSNTKLFLDLTVTPSP